jgi:hypothetical protein
MLWLNSFSLTEREYVGVKAGKEIQIANTVITLKKTSVEQILKLFKLEDIFCVSYIHWDGIDTETGEPAYGHEFVKNIRYKGIDFEFKGQTKNSLVLEWIRIDHSDFFHVQIDDAISLGDTNHIIEKYLMEQNKYDYISDDSLTYNLYSQGISFQFEKKGNDSVLKEVSIHSKIEEGENTRRNNLFYPVKGSRKNWFFHLVLR